MEDKVEITLPISKSIVEIRNYTTEADDDKSASILYLGVETEQEISDKENSKQSIKFPIANIMAAQKVYIPRLVQSIDGVTTNIALRLQELRSEDYAAVKEVVEKIVNEHSPKVTGAEKSSNPTTTGK